MLARPPPAPALRSWARTWRHGERDLQRHQRDTRAWTATAITVPVPTATTYPNTGPIRVTTSGQTATGANFTINAPATTSGRNVRNYGATGNGSTDDSAAVQRAFDAAQPGEAVYFPSGTYRLGATVNVQKSNLRIYGDGDASTISGDTTQRNLFYVKLAGAQLTGLKFEHLRLVGARVFDKNLNGGVAFYLESVPEPR